MNQGMFLLLFGAFPAVVMPTDTNPTPHIRVDPLTITEYDTKLEVVHVYDGQQPTGIAVSSSNRKFCSFPSTIDRNNTNDGTNGVFQVAELDGFNSETPYPNVDINNPPGGAIEYTQTPAVTKGLSEYLLGVQAIYIDSLDRFLILDTGRATASNGVLTLASPGCTKLLQVDLNMNRVVATFLFSDQVALPNSYFAEVRVDTQYNFAYIADSNPDENTNALVVLDLSTGESRRVLMNDPSVVAQYGFLPFATGDPVYKTIFGPNGEALGATFLTFGVDGLALSADGSLLFYSKFSGRNLYSIPTALLRSTNVSASEIAFYVRSYGEDAWGPGMTIDSNNLLYRGHGEQDGIAVYDTVRDVVTLFVHDVRIIFAYSLFVSVDGYLYFTVNQGTRQRINYPGQGPFLVDYREKAFLCFRAKLPNGAVKAQN